MSQARKEVTIEQCIKDIAGVSAEIKAARAGAAGAKQEFDFVKMVTTMAMDGAQERTKKTAKAKASSAKKGKKQKRKGQQAKGTEQDDAEQGWATDDDEDWFKARSGGRNTPWVGQT